MLSGATVLQNATTTQNGYGCDLDKLEEGSRLGVMRKSDGSLHFFINKQDCGVAASNVPSGKFTLSSLSSTKNNIDLGVGDKSQQLYNVQLTLLCVMKSCVSSDMITGHDNPLQLMYEL